MPVTSPFNAGAPIGVNGAVVTLINGTTFCLTTSGGEMTVGEPHGLFFRDTRLLSRWAMLLDGHRAQPMSVDVPTADRARFVARRRPGPGGVDSTLLVVRERRIDAGLVETIRLENTGRQTTSVVLSIDFEADFADLFAVKDGRATRAPLSASVSRLDVTVRSVADPTRGIRLSATGDPVLAAGRMTWTVAISPRQRWQTTITVQPIAGGVPRSTQSGATGTWPERTTAVSVSNAAVNSVLARSKADLDALRMADDGRAFVAAGAPWFMTLFGRDSLLTAWMCLPLDVDVAVGTLQLLALMQGTKTNPGTEEQPGRILHELRAGPDHTKAIGGREYYGSIDATPLFVMLLAEAWRWGVDPAIIRSLLPAADAGLAWLTGVASANGFVEYRRATDQGLVNQGWKDSPDGINDAAGALAEAPIALCEVQGYVYAALQHRAALADAFDDEKTARICRSQASSLRTNFARAFWMLDKGWYAVALDGHRRQVDALTSNVAHCLWTGIATDEHAEQIVKALAGTDMNTGYGLRTLSTGMGAYNPMSYHNGSVWPHDSAIAIAGLARYAHIPGAVELAIDLATGLFDAASAFGDRLPELFCGFARTAFAPPLPYPGACSPQAWASAAPLLVIRALLGLEPDEPTKTLRVRANLPPSWGDVSLSGLRLGEVTIRIRACGSEVTVEDLPASWKLVR